ncbi:MAG: SusC/RagA family TonB-linked outer membrane protein [Candidatus Pseudobacter hemicellulosilyticus]|uniref:SusC/RagA family TonB-linked outer membrane protein n=1 Tax=Candidatus Pseudobacter hemicellulosilyticus TaxID=3121375 RepID=A0AAJ6BEX3_9BACT|nr:MAG: SusC/RagA family TonB-linked outer membrane protein [Pseudobacter sp.]
MLFQVYRYRLPAAWAASRVPTKTLRVMKLTAFFLLICGLHLSAATRSQTVTLTGQQIPMKQVLTAIEAQTGFGILYDEAALQDAYPVTIRAVALPLAKFLEQVFRLQPLEYSIKKTTILINRKAVPPVFLSLTPDALKALPISGRVTDSTGAPLAGATITLRGSNRRVSTDASGAFSLEANTGDLLIISFVGYRSAQYRVPAEPQPVSIVLQADISTMSEVAVLSTGFQSLPKERATGSFTQVSQEMINRSVSTDILSRLNGLVPGMLFVQSGNPSATPTIRIRGESTLNSEVNKQPLIVLDNFPYEGNLNNINPNDIESITVLKDAAAASIWGARSGNGVIVITTKKGRLNQPLRVEFNANLNISRKQDLYYSRNRLSASQFIEVEDRLFNAGFFNADLLNQANRPALSPVVEIRARQRAGLIDEATAEAGINTLRSLDFRDDLLKYAYRTPVNQQYSLGLRGGSDKLAYTFSVGYDDNKQTGKRMGDRRFTLNSSAIFTPVKNLEISTGILYTNTHTDNNNPILNGLLLTTGWTSTGKYSDLYPYAQLADAAGNALPTIRDYRAGFIDSAEQLGFRDWRYRALDELQLADNTSSLDNLLLNVGVNYRLTPWLKASLQYRNERQQVGERDLRSQDSYYTRDLYNRFSLYDPLTKRFTYQAPSGAVLILNNGQLKGYNVRGQLSMDKTLAGDHQLTAIAGAEMRETRTSSRRNVLVGYDPEAGTVNMNLNFNTTYVTSPSGSTTLANAGLAPDGVERRTVYRYISYFANAAYTYAGRYSLTLSARKDGANIFGVKTNQRITPLWSAGAGWEVSREGFYQASWLPYLKLRATYGFNGNVYNGSAYPTGSFLTSPMTGENIIHGITTGNPELQWERVKIINLGIDFSVARQVVSGSIELYRKDGLDLLQTNDLLPQTGASSVLGNSASTRSHGIELAITHKNIQRKLQWSTTWMVNYLKDKVTHYGVVLSSSSIQYNTSGVALEGKPLYSLFSYRWAGLDPATGDPQGMLQGKVSKDYGGIIANFNADSLMYHGPSRPPFWGSLRNDLSWKGFSLSWNILFEMGHYFRRPSTSLNYAELISTTRNQNVDYGQRWQQPGDELLTQVPSLVYPNNTNRNNFYKFSEVLVTKGDHIRLQDLRIGYQFNNLAIRRFRFQGLQVFAYASNLGILWRANDLGIDPYAYSGNAVPNPFSMAFGLKANF